MELNPHADFMFGDWLTRQGLDAKGQYAYMKSEYREQKQANWAGSFIWQRAGGGQWSARYRKR